MPDHIMKDSLSKVLFWGVVVVLIAISVLTYRKLSTYVREVASVRHSNRVLRTLEVVLSSVKDAETGHRGYQLTRDSVFLTPYHQAVSTLPVELNRLDSLVSKDNLQSARVDTLEQLTENQFTIIGKILVNARSSGLYMDRYEHDLLLDGRRNMNNIRNLADRIRAAEEIIFRERVLSEADIRSIAPIYLLVYGLVALTGLVFLFTKLLDGLDKKKTAEDRLKENIIALRKEVGIREFTQKTLRSILDNSLIGIVAFRAIRNDKNELVDFTWTLANTISVEMTGYSEADLIGKRLLELIPETRTDGLFDIYKQVVETGVPRQFEHYSKSHGHGKWIFISAVKLEDGCIITFSDVTQQKLQGQLSEERMMLLNEAEYVANMGSWKWSEKESLIWSDGLYKILGKQSGVHVPSWNSFLDNVHSDDVHLVEEFLQLAIVRTGGSKLDYRIQLEERIHYLSIVAKPVQGEENHPAYVLGTVVDITERKVYENQLKQYTAELQRSNEDLEQFAYIASHDLQEPLRKIRAFGDRLSNKYQGKLEGLGNDYINRMQSAAARMQLLIEDILAFSRVSRNIGAFETLNMKKLMEEVVDDLDAQVKRENAEVRIGSLPNLNGDRAQIKRLFQNLISNAIKFHKPHEKPLVEVEGTTMKNAQVFDEFGRSLADKQFVSIKVKDNGIGFDEKYRDKIFNIFQRLHGRNEYEGTGIGLSICRKIAINHRGLIVTKSEENIGSQFIVILPIE